MPITKSAEKALRGGVRKKKVNDRRKKSMKEAIKKIAKLIKDGKKDEAIKMLSVAYQAVDKAAKTGVIKKNNASRKKSSLSKMVAK